MLPALLLFYSPPYAFTDAGPSGLEGIAGMSKVFVTLFLPVTVVTRYFIYKERNWPSPYRVFFILWLLALIPVGLGTYLGYETGNQNWTRGMRFLLLSGSIFYGLQLAQKDQSIVPKITQLFIVAAFFFLLLWIGHIWGTHLLFLYTGVSTVAGIFLLRKNPHFYKKLIGLFFLGFSALLFIRGTFTMKGIVIVSLGLALALSFHKNNKLATAFSRYAGLACILAALVFTVYTGTQSEILAEYVSPVRGSSAQSTLETKFQRKIFLDRGPLWTAAIRQIADGPYLIITGGRPLQGSGVYGGGWFVGCHNTFLETLRLMGISGLVVIALVLWALKDVVKIPCKSQPDNYAKMLITIICGVAVVGLTTGDFPLDSNVGFWLWMPCGTLIGTYLIPADKQRGGNSIQ